MKSGKNILFGFLIIALLAGCSSAQPEGIGPTETAGGRFVNEHLALDNPLYIPPLLEPRIENGEKVFDLNIQRGETQFFPGSSTATLGFNGSYLGPTIRATSGDKVRLDISNNLGETTTVHFHGMHLPAAMDGGPNQAIAPATTWQPNWTIGNEAATLWYHPHLMGVTGEQVYRGLAGLFIIDDANSASLDIPHDYGVDDIPLVVQDRQFDAANQFVYYIRPPGQLTPQATGMLGDTILVNGTLAPYVEVPRTLVRLRVVNGSNGRRYNFGFADNRPFYQIASDGGLLEAPVERTRMLLGAAERAEILVDLSDASGPITLMSYAFVNSNSGVSAVSRNMFGPNDENQQFKILELRPQEVSQVAPPIPTRLNTIVRPNEADAAKTRRLSLDASTIDGKSMDHSRIDIMVQKGAVEIWEIHNESPLYHPFHIHDVQFLVLSRDGMEPPAWERGWKDTIIVNTSETVRLIMRFSDYSDPNTPYMFHCHILEHEDMGMMGQFIVVDNPSAPIPTATPGEHHMNH